MPAYLLRKNFRSWSGLVVYSFVHSRSQSKKQTHSLKDTYTYSWLVSPFSAVPPGTKSAVERANWRQMRSARMTRLWKCLLAGQTLPNCSYKCTSPLNVRAFASCRRSLKNMPEREIPKKIPRSWLQEPTQQPTYLSTSSSAGTLLHRYHIG